MGGLFRPWRCLNVAFWHSPFEAGWKPELKDGTMRGWESRGSGNRDAEERPRRKARAGLGRARRTRREGAALTALHVVDEVLLQSVPADVGIAVVEITIPFAAVFAAELLRFPAGDGVEGVSLPDRHRGRRLLAEAGRGAVGLQPRQQG